jgi:hypothetical protein
MYNNAVLRQDFEIAVRIFSNAFGITTEEAIRQFRPTQSRLRLEQNAVTTTNSYAFPALNNQGAPTNTEIRLNQQDSFVPTAVGFYLGNPTGATDAAYKLNSYLNPFLFNVAMQSIYNGQLSIMLNKTVYLNNWPLYWHWKSNQTQQTAAAGANSPVDQLDGDCDGLKGMQPFVLLIGSSNIQISISVPVAPTAVTANSRLILVFDGILFQNSTVVV